MGMLDKLRNIFKRSNNVVEEKDDSYEKSMLATKILNLRDKIQRINSFDSSIWNLSNTTSSELERWSLARLRATYDALDRTYSQLTSQSQRRDPEREVLEASKWTGEKPQRLTNYEFDRLQRSDR